MKRIQDSLGFRGFGKKNAIKKSFLQKVKNNMVMVSFLQKRKILLERLPVECVNIIEGYYISLFYAEIVKEKILNSQEFQYTSDYYRFPSLYLCDLTMIANQSSNTIKKEILTQIARYILYNRYDYLMRHHEHPVGGQLYSELMDYFGRMLARNSKKWDMCGYYYEKIFFKPLEQS